MSLPSAPPSNIEILAQASTVENDSTITGPRTDSEQSKSFKSQKLSPSQRSLQLIGNALDAPSTIEASIYGGGAETDGGLDTVLDSSSIPVSPRISIDAEIYQLKDPSMLSAHLDWYKSRSALHYITKATNHCPAEMFLCEGMHRKRLEREKNEDLLENPDRAKLVRIFGNPRLYSGYASKFTICKTDSLKLLQRGAEDLTDAASYFNFCSRTVPPITEEDLVEAQPLTPTANILVFYGPPSARAGDAKLGHLQA